MKILKRGWITKKMTVFIILSFYYLYVVYSLTVGRGVFSYEQFIDFSFNQKLLYIIGIYTIWSIFCIKAWSGRVFLLFALFILANSFFAFYQTGNKIILLGTCFYLICSLFLYLVWLEELNSSMFNPNFYKNQLHKKNKYNLNVKIQKTNGEEYEGFLTNLDEYSCFVCLKNKAKITRMTGYVKMTLFLLGKNFHITGQIMTRCFGGLGVLLSKNGKKKKGTYQDWNDFYAIIEDRGILVKEKRGFL